MRIRAYELAVEHVLTRVATIPQDDQWARNVLLELLPLDEQRRLEMEVFLTLGTAAMTDTTLRRTHQAAHHAIHTLCAQAVHTLAVNPGDAITETERLHALIDGLALHLVRQDPADDTTWAVRVLDTHLDRLG